MNIILKSVCVIATSLCFAISLSAQNLVPNPSFETVNCGGAFSFPEIDECAPWFNTNSTTPDSFHPCHANNNGQDTPNNDRGNQVALTGTGYAGFQVYNSNFPSFREYMTVQLTSPLTPGNYEVSFYCNTAETTGTATGLGAYISTTPPAPNAGDLIVVTPQIVSPGVISDATNWVLVSGIYNATGGEEYITIGNFESNSSIVTAPTGFSTGFMSVTFYFIDDVSVVPTTVLPVELVSFNASASSDAVHLDWETASESNNNYFTIMCSRDGEQWDDIQTVQGAGNSSSTIYYSAVDQNPYEGLSYYRLRQTDFDGTESFSEVKSVDIEQGLDIVFAAPNPSDGPMRVSLFSMSEDDVNLTVISAYGSIVHQDLLHVKEGSNELALDLSHLSPGRYMMLLKSRHNRNSVRSQLIIE